MNIEEIKINCVNLIINNLNNYDYIPYYIKLPISKSIIGDMDEFMLDIKNKVIDKLPNLYCNINISDYSQILSPVLILKIDKIEK